ncbi:MAG: DUF4011 domain-containing protein, partial [Kofleriaceae bacterium]|nr:DUF4011 domain-containing protein [Kofleriaceae bacterium]
MIDPAARARLDRWKQSLLDPTDRLMDIGDDGIPLYVDPVRIAFSLAAGSGFAFESGTDPVFDTGRLRVALPAEDLERRLVMLRRAARAAVADGEHVLWLALGLVTWTSGEGASRVAPLALWPVELEAAESGSLRLVAAADMRPRVNDMLLEGLRREHDLVVDVGDELDLGALFETVAGFALTRENWRVDRVARLSTFSFARFDLWRDIEALDARVDEMTGPTAWLSGAQSAPTTLPASSIADVLAPLDADASQLAAVAAAGAGGSLVVQGAPGTGKSQTIANLVVHCASQGKTVLVVSDRATALDVVTQRLGAIGLGELCLPIYASHGSRAKVLGALSRVLDRSFRPAASGASTDARLAELRRELDGYASSVHTVGAFGMSLHDVIARLVELRTTPRAALAERDASMLDRAKFEARRLAIEALAEAAVPVEPVASHPWRMSALDAWTDAGTERATRALNEVASAIETLSSAIADVGALVPGIVAKTPEQLRALGALADLVAASPRPGAELLANMRGRVDETGERIALIRARGTGTIEVPRDPAAFLAIATRHRALVAEVDTLFTDSVEHLDVAELWSQLKRWTGSMAAFRYMALRSARSSVKAAAQPGQLESDEAMLTGLEAVIAERACRTALLAAAEPAKRWFGELGGELTLTMDLAKIDAAVAWGVDLRRAFDQLSVTGGEPGRQAAWRALVAQVSASPASSSTIELAPFARLAAAVGYWEPAVTEVAAATGIPKAQLGAGTDHIAALRDQVATLAHAVGSLGEWTRFHLARKAANVAGVGPAIAAIERGDLGATELAGAWQRATLLAWAELELAETPDVACFHGPTHHAHVAAFADLDRGSLALTRARAVARVAERVPRAKDPDPQIALLRGEAEQGNRGRALRTVLAELPGLLPRIAPCVLATPHAIAQHLDPSLPAFDVVVFDEASRLPAAHALPALARGKAVVVVGDSRQAAPADGEGGVLDLALAAKLPELTLTSHYRSRHEDLFAFANSRYYSDRIEVLPAPYASAELGIAWRKIDGTPDLAGANRAEADAIVAELRTRLSDPTLRARSYAIIVLSRAQQALVEDTLDAARKSDPAFAAALAAESPEPLVVGTPDRLQGEERDVVFVSIGDSADALGALAHPGGERWLTIAITRAREQLMLLSSFEPEDIIATDAAPSARDLADLLAFARAGGGAAKPPADVMPATPITAAIARALTERGWQLRHRVGCGAYKLDLAVVDPNDPDRYVLAIEHDGLAYASSTTARSRDRLRAQLLTSLGWRLHRVWALDWWLDPEREIQRAHGAIVAAVAASRQRRHVTAPHAVPVAPRPLR